MNRNRIDDGLDGTFELWLAQHEQKFRDAVGHQFAGVHVLQDVDSVLGEQFGVNGKDLLGVLRRNDFERPVVCAHGYDAEFGQISGPLQTEPAT